MARDSHLPEVEQIRTTRHILPNIEMSFRVNTMDFHTIANVMYADEYDLPLSFCSRDMIIDVGANIGCFAAMCLARGSKRVWCVEPDKQNFALLKKNLGGFRGVRLVNRAMWIQGFKEVNLANMHWYTSQHRVFEEEVEGSVKVKTIRLRTLVHTHGPWKKYKDSTFDTERWKVGPRRNFEPVRLVKIDAEGAEWPILFEADERELYNIKELMVELHPSLPVKGYNCTPEAMKKHLENYGFKVILAQKEHSGDNVHLRAQSLVTGDELPGMIPWRDRP